MISKELKKLSRRELVEVIYQLKKNEQEKQAQITALEEELQEKRVRISVAGSIAEAAMDITNVFSVAQTTADLYLQEISYMKEETARECAKLREEAEQLLLESKRQYEELQARYRSDYQKWQQLQAELQKSEADE